MMTGQEHTNYLRGEGDRQRWINHLKGEQDRLRGLLYVGDESPWSEGFQFMTVAFVATLLVLGVLSGLSTEAEGLWFWVPLVGVPLSIGGTVAYCHSMTNDRIQKRIKAIDEALEKVGAR